MRIKTKTMNTKDSNEFVEKPPLGVMPEWRHKELRKQEIDEAIARYLKAGKAVPLAWIVESYNLCSWIENWKEDKKETEEFKASKQSVSLDWEIREYGYRQRNDGGKDEQYIYSIRRLSDGQIFKIGDAVSTYNKGGDGFSDKIHHFTFTSGVDIIDVYFENKNSAHHVDYWLKHAQHVTLKEATPFFNEKKINERIKQVEELEEAFNAGKSFVSYRHWVEYKNKENYIDWRKSNL